MYSSICLCCLDLHHLIRLSGFRCCFRKHVLPQLEASTVSMHASIPWALRKSHHRMQMVHDWTYLMLTYRYHYLSVCCTFRTQRPDMDWMCGLESRIDCHTRPLLNKGSALFLVGCVNGDHLIRIGLARLRRSCILLGEVVLQGSGPAKYPMHICQPRAQPFRQAPRPDLCSLFREAQVVKGELLRFRSMLLLYLGCIGFFLQTCSCRQLR